MTEKKNSGKTKEKIETVEIGNVQEAEQKSSLPGEYTGDKVTLSQDQMFGIAGGGKFYEITAANTDGTFETVVHVAMPALLKHRSQVKSALRRHAEKQIALSQVIMSEEEYDAEKLQEKMSELENADIDALLDVAYFCFIRTDLTLKGLSMPDAKEKLSEWLDEGQLKKLPEMAMGLNKLERPPGGVG